MSLFGEWKELAGKDRSQTEYDQFWNTYFAAEKKNYEKILENKMDCIQGKLTQIAEDFGMDMTTIVGFIDGINSSLLTPVELDGLDSDAEVKLEIDFEKLYKNMLDAKADWLYNLPQWEPIFSEERRSEIAKDYNRSKIAVSNKIGRNDPCPCGSSKKYKKCCGK